LIRRATPAFVRLIGTPADTLVDTPVAECISCLPAGRVLGILNRVYRTGEPAQDVEITRGTDDQTLGSLSLTAWPVTDPKGRVTGLGLAVRDITKEAIERLQGISALEEMHDVNAQLVLAVLREDVIRREALFASDAKEAFLATMSHELRTPLNAIIGYAELLADGISGSLSATQQAQVERIRASSRHLLTLVDEVLTLSRLEAGREAVQCEPVELAAIVGRAAAIVSPLAGRKHLAFRVCSPETATTLVSDPVKIMQILVNLLENAVRFTDRGEIVLAARAEPDGMAFDVHDTGIGIDVENLEHVFAPFWQVECSHARRPGGTGLGLAVSRRLARLLGGDLTLASALGTGSTFTLRLPLQGPPAVPAGEMSHLA